jgi:hypothetical protein
MQNHLRPLSFGDILDSAFSLYRRHFVPFLTTTLIAVVPTSIVSGFLTQRMTADAAAAPDEFSPALIVMFLIGTVVSIVMWAALAREVGDAWTGHEVSVADGYRHGLRAFFPFLGAAIVAYALISVVSILVIFILAILIGIVAAVTGATGGTGASGAFALLMIPLVIVTFGGMLVGAAAMFAVLPAIVIEKLGPFRAIGRSVSLARGALLRVTGILIVAGLIIMLPMMGGMLLTGGFAAVTDPGAVPSTGQIWMQQLVNSVIGSLTTPFMVAALVILYFDRRVRTEALDVQLAADALATG